MWGEGEAADHFIIPQGRLIFLPLTFYIQGRLMDELMTLKCIHSSSKLGVVVNVTMPPKWYFWPNPMGAPSIERARKVLRPRGVGKGGKGREGRDVQYVKEE